MRTKTLLVAGCIALSANSAFAQQRSDFSGTWAATKDAPAGMTLAPIPVFGERFTFRQSGDNLTVIRPGRDTTVLQPFVLDGREVRTRVPGALCQGDTETIEVGAREGDAVSLTVIGSISAGGGAVTKRDIKRVFRLQAADTLVVEGRMAVQGELRQVATVYKRSTEALPEPNAASAPPKAPATIAQVAWIAGVWVGTNGQISSEERWTPVAGGSMIAVARTLRNGVMSAFEFLCINERAGSLVYSAMPNGRSPATHFTLTAVTTDSATFENPAHDYPKMIRYTKRADGSLETTISGEGGQRAQSSVLKREEK
jgi:Domain of unknown function (DUF6265)